MIAIVAKPSRHKMAMMVAKLSMAYRGFMNSGMSLAWQFTNVSSEYAALTFMFGLILRQ